MLSKLFHNKIKVKYYQCHFEDAYPIDNVVPINKDFKYTYVNNKFNRLKKVFRNMCGTYAAYYKITNTDREPCTIDLYLVSGKHTYLLEFHGYYGNENDSIYLVDYYNKERYVIDLTYNGRKANIIGKENEDLYERYLSKIIEKMRKISLNQESYNHKRIELQRLENIKKFSKLSERWFDIVYKYVKLHYKTDLKLIYNFRESACRGEIYFVDKNNECKIMLIFEYGCTSSNLSYWIKDKYVYYSATTCLFGYPLTGTNVYENHEAFIDRLKNLNYEISRNEQYTL